MFFGRGWLFLPPYLISVDRITPNLGRSYPPPSSALQCLFYILDILLRFVTRVHQTRRGPKSRGRILHFLLLLKIMGGINELLTLSLRPNLWYTFSGGLLPGWISRVAGTKVNEIWGHHRLIIGGPQICCRFLTCCSIWKAKGLKGDSRPNFAGYATPCKN